MTAQATDTHFKTIEDEVLLRALNELSRSVNISTTYGKNHPAALAAIETTATAMKNLFSKRKKIELGTFNQIMTIDTVPVRVGGTLLIALERRLARLRITGLKLEQGMGRDELNSLVALLTAKEAEDFKSGMDNAGLRHISSKATTFQAVREGEEVADSGDVVKESGLGNYDLGSGDGGNSGVIDLDSFEAEASPLPDIHVEQIVAFLKGDADTESPIVSKEMEELASDPARLANLIMESVSIRQSMTDFSGESLGDIVLGCLRKTYSSLREKQPFKSAEGKEELRKSLLMLEENVLDKLRALTHGNDPELDREIVAAMREMDETLGFEVAAMQYSSHMKAIEHDKEAMLDFVRSNGQAAADDLIRHSDIPLTQWHRIVVDDENGKGSTFPVAGGIETLTSVFERLETVIKSAEINDNEVKNLLGQASHNLDDSIDTTREKLDMLSRQLEIAKAGGTIGGQGRKMDQRELLAALAEVAQELMQPITAITASLEMMLHGFVGEITQEQRDLLDVAANSGEHLKYLMKELIDIVGCPANKGVDNRFHTTSDQVVQMMDAEGQEHLNLGYFQ